MLNRIESWRKDHIQIVPDGVDLKYLSLPMQDYDAGDVNIYGALTKTWRMWLIEEILGKHRAWSMGDRARAQGAGRKAQGNWRRARRAENARNAIKRLQRLERLERFEQRTMDHGLRTETTQVI